MDRVTLLVFLVTTIAVLYGIFRLAYWFGQVLLELWRR